MSKYYWLNSFETMLLGRRRPDRSRQQRASRLNVESLEDRVTPNAYTVSVLGDASGSNAGAGSGLNGDLRYCINQAITDDQVDTITFAAPVFFAPQTITLTAGLSTDPNTANVYGPTAFVISSTANITITGPASGVTLDAGSAAERLFAVTSTATLTLQNLTLENGSAAGSMAGVGAGGGAGLGGAVFDDGGSFTATGSTFTANTAQGGDGGGNSNDGGGAGGGLGGSGAAGTFGVGGAGGTGKNSAGPGGTGGFGGGGGSGGSAGNGGFGGGAASHGEGGGQANATSLFGGGTGTNSSSNGGAGGAGLGGAVFDNQGLVFLANDTFTADTATGGAAASGGATAGDGFGGAVFTRGGTLTASFVTFSLNTAAQGGTDVYVLSDGGDGGNNTSPAGDPAQAELTSDILGQSGTTTISDFVANTVGATDPPDLSGTNNLISDNGGFTGGTIDATDPLLGPLASNGGPTPTMALLTGSPAIGAGVAVKGITTDQRGTLQNTPPDIGSYAFTAVAPTVQFSTASETVNESAGSFSITVTLSAASSGTVTVPFTLGGSTTAFDNGTASPLTFAPDQTTATITRWALQRTRPWAAPPPIR